jgi:hypothetical protein
MYGVGKDGRPWPWGRTTGWKLVKAVLRKAGIAESSCESKALRYAFAVEAGQKGIPLNIVQRLRHARFQIELARYLSCTESCPAPFTMVR